MTKVVIALAVVLAGVFLYWRWSQSRQVATAPVPVATQPKVAPPPVDARTQPEIKYPIENVGGGRAAQLPALDESDPVMRDRLAGLFGARRLAESFFLEGIVRRIVATVDGLPREQVAPHLWAVKPVPGEFLTTPAGGGMFDISPKNAARYASRVALAEATDTRKLVALYVRHYPLFQRAYQELGYPQGYFNDRLIEVIDHLLSTPEPPPPLQLTRPRVRYEYVNPTLQSRSVGQKMLARMGLDHTAKLKVVLGSIREQVTGQKRLP